MLGCMEVIYDYLNMTVSRQELLSYFGRSWTVEHVARYLTSYGYVVAPAPPQDGDIIFQGNHPGIVRGDRVENIHFGRRVFTPLRRLRPEVILRQTCR